MSTENQNNEQQQNESGKIAKKFNSNLERVVKLLRGDKSLLTPTSKAPASELTSIIEELTKEEREKNREILKTKLRTLLDSYIKFVKDVDAKKRELVKLEEQKQKEFNEASDNLFKSITGEREYLADLEKALAVAAGNGEAPAEELENGVN